MRQLSSGTEHSACLRSEVMRPRDNLLVSAGQMFIAVILGSGALAGAFAQTPSDTVHWTAALAAGSVVKAGADLTVEVNGVIDEGWHVYGLSQAPGGPVPLRVTLDANDTASAAGAVSETPAQKIHDPRFNLDTQFHTHTLTLRVPVRLSQNAAGGQKIPVSIRFQQCSESECIPPRVVHVAVPIEVAARS
jgi:hypothetical protein